MTIHDPDAETDEWITHPTPSPAAEPAASNEQPAQHMRYVSAWQDDKRTLVGEVGT